MWGGFSVQNNTLHRFAILHYILPFMLVGLIGLHISLIHKVGSTSSLIASYSIENIQFYPYFIRKDFTLFSFIFLFFFYIVCLNPTMLNEVDIYGEANPLIGVYVIPEWYFLPLFGFIKCVRSKILGIFLILLFFTVLTIYPFFVNFEGLYVNTTQQNLYNFGVLNILSSYACLGYLAAQPLTDTIFFILGLYVF